MFMQSCFVPEIVMKRSFNIHPFHYQVTEDPMKNTQKNPSPCHPPVTIFVCIIMIALAGSLLAAPVSATPPSDMSISYNELSKDLQVTITHAVPNPRVHYIKEVIVTINGKVVNDSLYTSQPTLDTFTYTYPVVTVPGDEIEVTASCVLAGSLSRTLYNTGTMAPAPSQAPEKPATQKATLGLVPLAGAAAALLIRKK
jgi:hypothetical protein